MVRNSHRDARQVALSVISSPYQLDGYMVLGKCLTNTIFNLITEGNLLGALPSGRRSALQQPLESLKGFFFSPGSSNS